MSCACQAAGRCRYATIAKAQRCCSHHGGGYAWACTGPKVIMQLHMLKSSIAQLAQGQQPQGRSACARRGKRHRNACADAQRKG